MTVDTQDLKWPRFWFFEVILVTVPFFAAVLALPKGGNLSHTTTGVLVLLVLVLTAVNLAITRPRLPNARRRRREMYEESVNARMQSL